MKTLAIVLSAGLLLSSTTGCIVPKDKYDRVVVDAAKAKADAERTKKDDDAEIAKLRASISQAEAAVQEREGRIAEIGSARHNLQASLDEATAINQQIRGELERLGRDVDKMLKERGTMTAALDEAKARLEELRRAQASADARAAIFQDFARRFQPLVEAGQVRIEARHGHPVVVIASDVVFESGRADLRSAGKGTLMELAKALQGAKGRKFQIAVHTDATHTKSRRFPTSWDLSAAQASEIVKYLVSVGVQPDVLAASAHAEFDPAGPNDTAQARAKNRRIEILLEPDEPAHK